MFEVLGDAGPGETPVEADAVVFQAHGCDEGEGLDLLSALCNGQRGCVDGLVQECIG